MKLIFQLLVKSPNDCAGDPKNSEMYHRMATTEAGKRMPPLATRVDEVGLQALRDWIQSLPQSEPATAGTTGAAAVGNHD